MKPGRATSRSCRSLQGSWRSLEFLLAIDVDSDQHNDCSVSRRLKNAKTQKTVNVSRYVAITWLYTKRLGLSEWTACERKPYSPSFDLISSLWTLHPWLSMRFCRFSHPALVHSSDRRVNTHRCQGADRAASGLNKRRKRIMRGKLAEKQRIADGVSFATYLVPYLHDLFCVARCDIYLS